MSKVSGGDIEVTLTLNGGQYTAAIKGAGAEAGKFAAKLASIDTAVNRTERRVHGLTATIRDWTLIIGQARNALNQINFLTTGWMTNIVKANAEVERMTFLMKGLSRAAGEAAKMKDATDSVAALFDMAKKAPFQVNALSDAFVKMKSVGIEPLKGPLAALVDGVAAFGGTSEILHRASIAVQQMAGKGVISMEELRQQMGEAVPRSIELMARSMGVGYGELVDQISKGNVEARHALAAMFGEFERVFGGRAEALMESFNGQWAKFLTNLTLLKTQSEGMKSFFEIVKNSLREINQFLESPMAAQFANEFGSALAYLAETVKSVIHFMIEWRGVLANLATALAAGFGLKVAISLLAGFRTRVLAAAAAIAAETVAVNASAAAKTNAAAKNVALASSLGGVTGAARGAAVGIRAVGVAIGGMLGPIGLAVTGLFGLASALDIFGSSHKKALAAIAEGRLITGTEDINDRTEAIAGLTEKIDLYERRLEKQNRRIANLDRSDYYSDENFKRALAREREIADSYQRTIDNTEREIIRVEEMFRGQVIAWNNLVSTGIAETLLEGVRSDMSKLAGDYDETMKSITESTKSGSKERVEATVAAQATLYQGSIDLYQAFIDTQRAQLEQGIAQDRAAVEKAIAEANNKIVELRERQEAGAEAARAGFVLTGGGGGDKKAGGAANRILSVQQQFAKVAKEIAAEAVRSTEAMLDPLAYVLPKSIEDLRIKLESMLNPLERLAPKSKKAAEELANLKGQISGMVAAQAQNELNAVVAAMNDRTRAIKRSLMGERQARKAEYDDEVKRLENMKAKYAELNAWRVEDEVATQELLKALRDQFLEDTKGPLDRWADEWKQTAANIEQWMADSFRSMSQELANFITEGEMDLASFAKNMLNTFLQIQINSALSAGFNALNNGGQSGGFLSGVGNWIQGLFYHKGGLGSAEATFARAVPASAWEMAPRFHRGRVPLAQDEIAAVIKEEEGVFTSEQMAAIGKGLSGRDVQVNVINASGVQVDAEQGRPRFEGDKLVLDVVLRAVSRPGAFRDNFKAAIAQ